MKSLCTFLLILILSLIFASSSWASQEYTVSPLVIDESLEGRDIVIKDITITNTGSQPVTIYPTVNNISLKEGGTIEKFLQPVESDRTTSLASWIEISRLGIDLKVTETKTIPLTLRINPNPVPGTYHALVSFPTGGTRDEAEKHIAEGGVPRTVITVTIADSKSEFLKLTRFIVDKFVTSPNNQAAVFTFNNPGDETVTPNGEIIFYDSRGREVGVATVNPESLSIKPGEEKLFATPVPISGLFGKYKAYLSVDYGTKQRASLQDTSFFYVFPVKIIGIVLLVLIIGAIVMSWHVHKKYFDEAVDDSERITVHVRTSEREAMHHDIDLKKKNE
jgi:hypothetical protein